MRGNPGYRGLMLWLIWGAPILYDRMGEAELGINTVVLLVSVVIASIVIMIGPRDD